MYFLYIIKSKKDSGYYIGITDNIENRLAEHNRGKTKSTKSRIPFDFVHSEMHSTKTEARKREIQLKKNYQIRKELLQKLGFNIK